MDAIKFIKADGSVEINEKLKGCLNFEEIKLQNTEIPEFILVSILLLIYLENNFSKDKISWKLIFKKAITNLQQKGVDYF